MSSRAPSKAYDLLAAELEDLSIRTHYGSVQSASWPSTPYVRRDFALESRRIHDFLEDAPPYMRRQSDAASRRSMAQKLQAFDLAFEGPSQAPRRATC